MKPPEKPSAGSQIIALILGFSCIAFGIVFLKMFLVDGAFDTAEILFLVILLPFVLVGILIIWINSYASIEDRKQEYQNGLSYSNEPWMWKKEWANGRIKCDGNSESYIQYFAAFFCGCFTLIFGIVAIDENSAIGIFFSSLIGLLAGIYLLSATSKLLNYLYFGQLELHLEQMPVKRGEILQGVIHGLKSRSRIIRIKLILECRQHVSVADGPREVKVVYKQRKKLRPKREVDELEFHMPIELKIPEELPATNWQDTKQWIEWVLVVSVNDKGREHKFEFVLPIF